MALYLTQSELNEPLRGMTDVEILMFTPDKNVYFSSNAVKSNTKTLAYTSNLRSLIEFSSLPQANLATFENNMWILDGSFVSPSEAYGGGGDSYTGYISDAMTDDDGNYTTNPIITVSMLAPVPQMDYISIKFSADIDTSYPKQLKIRTYGQAGEQIRSRSMTVSSQSGLPLLSISIGDRNVMKVEFELVGTVCPHRRSRIDKIMFGKVEKVDPYYLQSWSVDDKVSLVADSIPTKTLTYSIINYDRDYDVDNPGAKVPENYRDVLVLFTFGMETNGVWKYAPTKVFNLTDISTDSSGIVTFTCGSILDMLTDIYDQDLYIGPTTLEEAVSKILSAADVNSDQCLIEKEFQDYEIRVPLPEAPARELIQELAYSCGATLTVNNENKIVFSKKNIRPSESSMSKFMFNEPSPFNSAAVLLDEPVAEALEHTKNIAMHTYKAKIPKKISEVATVEISNDKETRISFSAVAGGIEIDAESLDEQKATVASITDVASQHAVVRVTIDKSAGGKWPVELKILGLQISTTKSTPKRVSADTLMLDTGLSSAEPSNLRKPSENPDKNTFYYTDWYNAKFKYVCKTRQEYLVNAGDIILFETPFSKGKANKIGYVLRNSYSNDGDSGEMEVIALGSI